MKTITQPFALPRALGVPRGLTRGGAIFLTIMSIQHVTSAWAIKLKDPQAKLVLVKLADHANKEGVCWPSLSIITADTELHRATVCRKIDMLESMGLITRTRGKNNCIYTLLLTQNQSQGATTSERQPVAGSDYLEGKTSRRVRPVAGCDQSQGATQVVAGCDLPILENRKEPPLERKSVGAQDDWGDWDEPEEPTKGLCTLQQAIDFAPTCRMSREHAEHWWHTRHSTGWTKGSAGGGPARKITSWQSDMATSASWVGESAEKAKHAANGKAGTPLHRQQKASREYAEDEPHTIPIIRA